MAKRVTNESFKQRSQLIHNNKFDYSLVQYDKPTTKLKIICPEHGVFEQMAYRHLAGAGCFECGVEERAEKRRMGDSFFIKKAIEIHGYKFDYSQVQYLNNFTKVKIKCSKHGLFEVSPAHHLNGVGCSKCNNEYQALQQTLTDINEFISRAKIHHGDLYNYTTVELLNRDEYNRVLITCPKHGGFLQEPRIHLKGHGCPKCNNWTKQHKWLDGIGVPNTNETRQVRLKLVNGKSVVADGFDPTTNTIYEFWGNFWHGNPRLFDPLHINAVNKKSFGELYKKTLEKINLINESGYKLVDIWEDIYDQTLKI